MKNLQINKVMQNQLTKGQENTVTNTGGTGGQGFEMLLQLLIENMEPPSQTLPGLQQGQSEVPLENSGFNPQEELPLLDLSLLMDMAVPQNQEPKAVPAQWVAEGIPFRTQGTEVNQPGQGVAPGLIRDSEGLPLVAAKQEAQGQQKPVNTDETGLLNRSGAEDKQLTVPKVPFSQEQQLGQQSGQQPTDISRELGKVRDNGAHKTPEINPGEAHYFKGEAKTTVTEDPKPVIGEVQAGHLPNRLTEMVKSMMLKQNPGSTTINLKLQPHHLGEVAVKLTWSKGELQAHFVAATSIARELLESSFPQLKQLLAQQDIKLSEAAVFMNQHSQPDGRGSDQQNWQYRTRLNYKGSYLTGGNQIMEQSTGTISNTEQGLNIVV